MQYAIHIDNFADVRRVFQQAPMKMSNEITMAIRKSILVLERNIKREAPVNKQTGGGNLRQSIRSEMTGKASGMVEVGAEYGAYVEGGTRPHIIRATSKKVLANKRTGEFFGTVVHHPGTKANPFVGRGVDASGKEINTIFGEAVISALK